MRAAFLIDSCFAGRKTRRKLPFLAGRPPRFRRKPVNKNDLVQKLSERTALSKIDAQKAVDGIFDVITDSLKSGEEVRVTGFGVFKVSTRAGGKGRRPGVIQQKERAHRRVVIRKDGADGKAVADPMALRRRAGFGGRLELRNGRQSLACRGLCLRHLILRGLAFWTLRWCVMRLTVRGR